MRKERGGEGCRHSPALRPLELRCSNAASQGKLQSQPDSTTRQPGPERVGRALWDGGRGLWEGGREGGREGEVLWDGRRKAERSRMRGDREREEGGREEGGRTKGEELWDGGNEGEARDGEVLWDGESGGEMEGRRSIMGCRDGGTEEYKEGGREKRHRVTRKSKKWAERERKEVLWDGWRDGRTGAALWDAQRETEERMEHYGMHRGRTEERMEKQKEPRGTG